MILDRRLALLGGLAGLSACATNPQRIPAIDTPRLMPVRAHMRRVFDITVCSRPFRAAGPRLNTEMLGDTLVVHNYGHGGSGWSLSWGSAQIVLEKALARGDKNLAVIGCGALGLTTAVLALKMGCSVTLYAKELLPLTRSARATGSWTPDSRIALRDDAGPAMGDLWERMARFSWKSYRSYLGLPGKPVEFGDRYYITDGSGQNYYSTPNALAFAQYSSRITDIVPSGVDMPPGSTPFQFPNVRRTENMVFNVASYGHTLMAEFYAMGGKLEVREFHEPAEFTRLKQKVVINCTGYGARSLWKDESLIPVRGQIAWLVPQPEVTYGVNYRGVQMIPRSDGIVIQMLEGGDMRGYNEANEVVDRAEAAEGISRIAELYTRFQ
jgi:glycine/D-amino acid oxidase-like deaminating enzyme